MPPSAAFAALRDTLDVRYRTASSAAFVQADGTVLATGVGELDRALAGGFPKGAISTLEGPASSGRTALAARLLAAATERGLGAVVLRRDEPGGALYPPSLAAAGVALERLALVAVETPLDAVRATDILLRSGAFGAIVLPALPSSPRVGSAAWSRLASLAHRAGAALVAIGTEASTELRYFATVRVECTIASALWNGAPGPFRSLCGYELGINVRKHKRAAPNGAARVCAAAA